MSRKMIALHNIQKSGSGHLILWNFERNVEKIFQIAIEEILEETEIVSRNKGSTYNSLFGFCTILLLEYQKLNKDWTIGHVLSNKIRIKPRKS